MSIDDTLSPLKHLFLVKKNYIFAGGYKCVPEVCQLSDFFFSTRPLLFKSSKPDMKYDGLKLYSFGFSIKLRDSKMNRRKSSVLDYTDGSVSSEK